MELTRDDIKRACEAVGWEWWESKVTPGGAPDSGGWDGRLDRFPTLQRRADQERSDNADALAMLDARAELSGCSYSITAHRAMGHRGRWYTVTIVPGPYDDIDADIAAGGGPNLPEAAVRAVLAWAEAKSS